MKHTYTIIGMTCDHCQNHVQNALNSIKGVKHAEVSLHPAEATIEMDKHIGLEVLQAELSKIGDYKIENAGQHQTNEMAQNHHMGHNVQLKNSNIVPQELRIPPVLKPVYQDSETVKYSLTAQEGVTEIFPGFETKTKGYSSSILGPAVIVKRNQNVEVELINKLNESTTFHWHGLKIPAGVDGGPHDIIGTGKSSKVHFKVQQDSATLWFHPHPMGATARQVYEGLAGLLVVQEENKNLVLPQDYGVNDIPVVVQDRYFTKDYQIDYEGVRDEDGTQGDTLMINGTVNPYFNFDNRWLRLRLLNGSNARNFEFYFENHLPFIQIASDGGLLEKPVKMTKIFMSPGERAEILLDTSSIKASSISLLHDRHRILLINLTKGNMSDEVTLLPHVLNTFPHVVTDKLPVKKIELYGMGKDVMIDGKKFDMNRIDLSQHLNSYEIWQVYNKPDSMGGMIHPFHIHGTQFRVLARDAKGPKENEYGWKDTVHIEAGETISLLVNFEHKGVYMYHCHNLEHEENGMMGQIEIQ